MTIPAPQPSQTLQPKRWLGVLLSWLMPGFGLQRTAFIRRAITWILFLNVASIILASLFICSLIPTWVCLSATLLFWTAGLAMLVDTCRTAPLTIPLFIVFLVLLALTDMIPSAGHIVARPFMLPTGAMQPTLKGTIALPNDISWPGVLNRTADLVIKGRRHIDVVSKQDDEVVQVQQLGSYMTYSRVTCRHQSFVIWAAPETLKAFFTVFAGRSYHAGDVMAQGAIDTGDHFLVDKLLYKFHAPRRGDLVVFSTVGIAQIPADPVEGQPFYIKRVAGIPGDTLRIDPPLLYINGQLAEGEGFRRVMGAKDGYRGYAPGRDYLASPDREFRVPENSYFVLGDNSYNSYDSRYWGCVPAKNIYGRVARVYFPLSRAGVHK